MKFIGHLLKTDYGDKVTVALSAGVDSVAILHFLRTRYPKNKIQAFHFNHNLRPQNNKMKKAAQELAIDLGVPFSSKTRTFCLSENPSEESLRKQRYQAMMGLGTVITGHHLDDACESYLFNCFNGTPEHLPIPVVTDYGDMELKVIRPFIMTPKYELVDYVDKNDLWKYVVEDETNQDEKYRRNWLRNNLIPKIHEKGYNLHTIIRKRYDEWSIVNSICG